MLDALDPATVERASKNVERATSAFAQTVEQNRADLRQAIVDFRDATRELNRIASSNSKPIATSIADFGDASRKLAALSERLSTTAEVMERVATRLDRGEGSLGKAVSDSLLYDEMLETVRNTNRLVKDIQKNPKRYLKVSVF